jgi:hypothetical protein
MSDPKPDDRANDRLPEADPADAAARLAALFAKPLEPVTRSHDGTAGRRDIPVSRPQWRTTPADPTRADDAARPPPVAPVRSVEPSVTPVEPVAPAWSTLSPSPDGTDGDTEAFGVQPADALAGDAPAADEPPTDAPIDEAATNEMPTGDGPPGSAPTVDPLAELSDAMAKLVGQSVRHRDDAMPADDAGATPLTSDEWPPAEPQLPPSAPAAAPAAPEPAVAAAPTAVDEPDEPVASAIKPLRPARPAQENSDAEAPLDPAAARIVKRVRRLMLISSLTTVVGVGAIFGVIGYRIYKSADMVAPLPVAPAPPEPAPAVPVAPAAAVPTEVTLALPKDARIIMTAVAEDRLVITLDLNGTIEIRTYDLKTLQPLARMSFTTVP